MQVLLSILVHHCIIQACNKIANWPKWAKIAFCVQKKYYAGLKKVYRECKTCLPEQLSKSAKLKALCRLKQQLTTVGGLKRAPRRCHNKEVVRGQGRAIPPWLRLHTEYYIVFQSIAEYYRVLHIIPEYCRILQSIPEYC